MPKKRTNAVRIKSDQGTVRLNVNKSGVLYVPGQGAVGYMQNGVVVIDGSMLATLIPSRRKEEARIGSVQSLIEELGHQMSRVTNRGGALYGVLDMAQETLSLAVEHGGWVGEKLHEREKRDQYVVFQIKQRGGKYGAIQNLDAVSHRRHTNRTEAVREMTTRAMRSKTTGSRFVVVRFPGLNTIVLVGNALTGPHVIAAAEAQARANRSARDLARHGCGRCSVITSKPSRPLDMKKAARLFKKTRDQKD